MCLLHKSLHFRDELLFLAKANACWGAPWPPVLIPREHGGGRGGTTGGEAKRSLRRSGSAELEFKAQLCILFNELVHSLLELLSVLFLALAAVSDSLAVLFTLREGLLVGFFAATTAPGAALAATSDTGGRSAAAHTRWCHACVALRVPRRDSLVLRLLRLRCLSRSLRARAHAARSLLLLLPDSDFALACFDFLSLSFLSF
mmetsp:Transcript_7070/g.14198  ORF Transcript_7070/g.14198 Transcript_7070/m.14198 type:complete len:202 (-) Transcript_7070:1082-1687(-)